MSQSQQAVVVVTQIITLSAPFRYNSEITNDLSKRPFFHKNGRQQTRVARSKRVKLQMGSHQNVRPVLPSPIEQPQLSAPPSYQMSSTPSPPNRSIIKFS